MIKLSIKRTTSTGNSKGIDAVTENVNNGATTEISVELPENASEKTIQGAIDRICSEDLQHVTVEADAAALRGAIMEAVAPLHSMTSIGRSRSAKRRK